MNTALVTDHELIMAFSVLTKQSKTFQALYVADGIRTFNAKNKTEAVKIAREYGTRILNLDLIQVYAVKDGE
jgi:hypothetical protein